MNCLDNQEMLKLLSFKENQELQEKANKHLAECDKCFHLFMNLEKALASKKNTKEKILSEITNPQNSKMDFDAINFNNNIFFFSYGDDLTLKKEKLLFRNSQESLLTLFINKSDIKMHLYFKDQAAHFLSLNFLKLLQILIDNQIRFQAPCEKNQVITLSQGKIYSISTEKETINFRVF